MKPGGRGREALIRHPLRITTVKEKAAIKLLNAAHSLRLAAISDITINLIIR